MDGDGRLRDGVGTLVIASLGLVVAGVLALVLSVSGTFLPYEFSSLGLTPADLCAIADCRVNGFMAHDRAALGGALVGLGLQYCYLVSVWYARLTPAMWRTILVAGTVSLTAAIGTHLAVGYLDAWHLAPPTLGALSLIVGLALCYPRPPRVAAPAACASA